MDEIMAKAKEFRAKEVGMMYAALAIAKQWMDETGGTLEDMLLYIENNCPKRN